MKLMVYPEKFIKEPSKRTPWILMEPGKIFIMGRSIPENPGDFYRPVREWVSNYVQNYSQNSNIDLGFEYINTSSTKWIYSIIKELSEMKGTDSNIRVTWYYEEGDEDMCDLGNIMRTLVGFPFVLVEVDEMNNTKYEKILTGSV